MPKQAVPPIYPAAFSFKVEVTGVKGPYEGSFQEVSGISVKLNTEPLKEGGENTFIRRLPLPPQYENLILKRGVVLNSGLIGWARDAVEKFMIKPATVDVSLLDATQLPIATWSFLNAYPVALKISELKAQENAIACEILELAYDSFKRIK
jgi:phage tail-like protein